MKLIGIQKKDPVLYKQDGEGHLLERDIVAKDTRIKQEGGNEILAVSFLSTRTTIKHKTEIRNHLFQGHAWR